MTRENMGLLRLEILDSLRLRLIQIDKDLVLAEGSAGEELFRRNPVPVEISEAELTETGLGMAMRRIATGIFQTISGGSIRQTLVIDQYTDWPDAWILSWQLENTSSAPVRFDRLSCPGLYLQGWNTGKRWTFQGAAVHWGQDFAFELPDFFERENFLGHIDHGEGGGIPLLYCWNADYGLALAHIEAQPKDWYMPVSADPGRGVRFALQNRQPVTLPPGKSWRSLRTLISVHQGDFFAPLALYREILSRQGLRPAEPNAEDYEPAWCSWGYEFDVLPSEITGVLPKLADLEIHWLAVDDRWFDAYGDWNPRGDTFPGGETQMRHMVDVIHQAGCYAQLWWYPLAVEDGIGSYDSHNYRLSEIVRQHPDWLILNPDSSTARNNRGLAILDPALPAVQSYIAAQTHRFIEEWDFDGHKLDNIYTVPPCFNPAHHHATPEESTKALAEAYRIIFKITRARKPFSVTQICPCGTPPTFSLLPYMDQSVTADPTSSAQIRQRVKFYKALLGPRAPVYADHIELSDEAADFASQIGAGGIPGTKFIWPEAPDLRARLQEWWSLTPEKETCLRQWLKIYRELGLSNGEYLNLYDLAFEQPESHVIRKGDRFYYAFYTPRIGQSFTGEVHLRGLKAAEYQVRDVLTGRILGGPVCGPQAELPVSFQSSLLLEVCPVMKGGKEAISYKNAIGDQ